MVSGADYWYERYEEAERRAEEAEETAGIEFATKLNAMQTRAEEAEAELAECEAQFKVVAQNKLDAEAALRKLVTAVDHMGAERELLDEVHYARDEARAALPDHGSESVQGD